MIQRILTGWTLTRVVFLILGAIMIGQAIWDKQWIGIAFGSYFALMGLFALGCASGNCAGGYCSPEPVQKPDMDIRSKS